MSAKNAVEELLSEPKKPLRYRIPNDGPSPREYELLALGEKRALTEAEAAELRAEQDSRTEMEAAWAEYREQLRAYYAQQARMNANA